MSTGEILFRNFWGVFSENCSDSLFATYIFLIFQEMVKKGFLLDVDIDNSSVTVFKS